MGLGLRLHAATDRALDRAFAAGSILRTHLLRPTWHFVTPADIRWLLALTAPRVHAVNASMNRKLGLDGAIFKRSQAALAKALPGGQHLTREELRRALEKDGIAADGLQRMAYLMMHAELDGLICSGARRGKQFTYALLEERVPHARVLGREDALAELARRYFISRGPATDRDFAKWSGLTLSDARRGLEAVKGGLEREVLDGREFWSSEPIPRADATRPEVHLLSIYDEYISGYEDRSDLADPETAARLVAMGNSLTHILVLDGRITGTWKRTVRRDALVIEASLFRELTKSQMQALSHAAQRYGAFLEMPVELIHTNIRK